MGGNLSPDVHPVAKDALCGLLDEMKGKKRQAYQEQVADPWVEARQAESVEQVRVVDHVPQIEVQQVEAIASLADEDERREAEELRQWVDTGKAKNNATEQGHEEA